MAPTAATAEVEIMNALFSGSFAGGLSTLVGAPFDTIKVRLQTQAHQFNGVRDCITRMVAEERLSSLYKGVAPALTAAVIENTVVFGANAITQRALLDWRTRNCGHRDSEVNPSATPQLLSLHELAAIGGFSGVFSATAICPAEVVKCRMQAQHTLGAAGVEVAAAHGSRVKYKTSWDCVRYILKREGMRGMFRGLPMQMARDIPFNFAFFGSYEVICHFLCTLHGYDSKDQLQPFDLVAAGGLAGAAGWTVTVPMDTVKSCVQVSECQSRPTAAIIGTVSSIWANSGPRGFFRGWSAVVMRAFPANGALFLGYEMCMRFSRTQDTDVT